MPIDTRLQSFLSDRGGDEILSILEHQSDCLQQHQRSVAQLASQVCQALNLPGQTEFRVYIAAALHDIGMHEFSLKHTTNVEQYREIRDLFKHHCDTGARLISSLQGGKEIEVIANIVFQHHERLDGSGFPQGISNACLESQIIAAADVLDSIYSLHAHDTASAFTHVGDEHKRLRNGLLSAAILDATLTTMRDRHIRPASLD